MNRKVALIAGATGHVGSQLVGLLTKQDDWQVITLGRSEGGRGHIAADLLSGDLDTVLSGAPRITHLFYCARAPHNESGSENVTDNVLMLRRLVEALERMSPALAHIHIVEGGKWYGAHLGPYKTPAKEDDPRHQGENFYHAQEDWLREQQLRASWSWSASRPSFVCAVTPGRGRNMISTLGAYAAICREAGEKLDFPGSERSYGSRTEITDGPLLARAIKYLSTEPSAGNHAFNVTNGNSFRWADIWDGLAEFYSLTTGNVGKFRLAEWATGKDSVWRSIVARYGLQPSDISQVANWQFADFFFGQDYDVVSSTDKIKQCGFLESMDSKRQIFSVLAEYRNRKILA